MNKLEDNNMLFENIKHIDDNGNEYWLARELQRILEYKQWRRFENVINKSKTYHTTVVAKNMAGVQAIYRLVTDSNLKYNHIRPRIRLSELLAERENLLIGNACSSGFLYDHILMGKSNEVIEKTASMYDFLEIQPVNENMYFINK